MPGVKSSFISLFKRLRSANKIYLAVGGVAAMLVIVSAGFLLFKDSSDNSVKNVVTPADTCSQNNDVTFSCYKDQLEQKISTQGPEYAFALLKDQYDKVGFIKSQCHQLVHVVGRASYAKYGNLSDTFAHGDQFCWSGYYHGVMEELSKSKGKEVIKTANSICADLRAKESYSFYHYNCVHGLGHGFMFILEQKMFESLNACDSITDSYERTSCYGGVFMQNIMNVQSPDRETNYGSPYLKTDDPMYPCTAVEDKYKQQCYLMQTSYALQLEGNDFKKVFGLCDSTPQAYRDTCYQSLGRDASGQSISNVEQTKANCLLGKDFEAQSNCIIGAAKDFVSYFHSDQQAKQLCASLPSSLSSTCLSTVVSYYSSF